VLDEPGAAESCGDIAIPLKSGAVSAKRNELILLGALIRDPTMFAPPSEEFDGIPYIRIPAVEMFSNLVLLILKYIRFELDRSGKIVKSRPDVDCTMFKSVGVAVQDVATAFAVVEKAKQLGLGVLHA